MADYSIIQNESKQIISRYGDGGFVVNGKDYNSAIFICSSGIFSFPTNDLESILSDKFDFILENSNVDEFGVIMLFGMGTHIKPISEKYLYKFKTTGISLEFMNTGAACRTLNVLQAEDRAVSALLIPVT